MENEDEILEQILNNPSSCGLDSGFRIPVSYEVFCSSVRDMINDNKTELRKYQKKLNATRKRLGRYAGQTMVASEEFQKAVESVMEKNGLAIEYDLSSAIFQGSASDVIELVEFMKAKVASVGMKTEALKDMGNYIIASHQKMEKAREEENRYRELVMKNQDALFSNKKMLEIIEEKDVLYLNGNLTPSFSRIPETVRRLIEEHEKSSPSIYH